MKNRDIPGHSSTTIAGLTQGSLLPHQTPTYKQTRNCKIAVKQKTNVNTLRTGDADLRFYVTTVRDG